MAVNYIACPECRGVLNQDDASLECRACGQKYDSKWGFPLFSKNRDFYYCPTDKEFLTTALDEYYPKIKADPLEWERFLVKILGNVPDNRNKNEWVENLVDESRGSYKYLLSLKPGSHVLNYGCGWDNTTISLARTASKVTAVDLTRQRVQVLALKKLYYGLDNIDLICCGDRPYLPFADNTFDAVFVNGVLEWVASDWSREEEKYRQIHSKPKKALKYLKEVYTSHRPRDIQLRMLMEWNRILKPEGELYIGIENRHSREYFGQRPDAHSSIWFGSLYPRPLANLVSLATRHRPYLTHTYSRSGYAKLLREAAFKRARFFSIEPTYRRPTDIINLDRKTEVREYIDNADSRVKKITPWIYSRTCTSFGMSIKKESEPQSWVYDAVSDFFHKTDRPENQYQVRSIKANRKNKFMVFVTRESDPEEGFVLKAPINDGAKEFLANNREGLNHVHAMLDNRPDGGRAGDLLPKFVYDGSFRGQPYSVESICPGRSWSNIADSEPDGRVLDDLVEIMAELSALDFGEVGKERLSANFKNKVDCFRPLISYENTDGCCVLDRITDRVLAAIDSYDGVTHLRKGDFTMGNVLVKQGRPSGLIDFDEHGATCFKLADFAELVYSFARIRDGVYWADSTRALVTGEYDRLPAVLKIKQRLQQLDSSPDDLKIAAVSAWVNHVYYAVQHEAIRFNARIVGKLLDEVLTALDPVLC